MTAGPAACDVYTLTVDLDPAFWQDKTGGVRVQIDGLAPPARQITTGIVISRTATTSW